MKAVASKKTGRDGREKAVLAYSASVKHVPQLDCIFSVVDFLNHLNLVKNGRRCTQYGYIILQL
jgi:hypothetical protein